MRAKEAHERRMQDESFALSIAERTRVRALHAQMSRANDALKVEVEKINAEWRAAGRPLHVSHDYGDYTPRRLAGDADEGD